MTLTRQERGEIFKRMAEAGYTLNYHLFEDTQGSGGPLPPCGGGGGGGALTLPYGGVVPGGSGVTLVTKGKLTSASAGGGVCPTQYLLTQDAPLTKGDGSGHLATLADITLYINGTVVTPKALDPLQGIILLFSNVNLGVDTVEIDYYTTKGQMFPFAALNNPSFQLNQGTEKGIFNPFWYSTSLSPGEKDQPALCQQRAQAFQLGYSALLNDPLSLVLNQLPCDLQGRFQRPLSTVNFTFEGDVSPAQAGFTYQGLTPGTVLPSGRYLLTDSSISQDLTSAPSFLSSEVTLDVPHTAAISYRFRLLPSWTLEGDFTGQAFGYADGQYLYWCGILEIQNKLFPALLTHLGDESLQTSYQGFQATVIDRDVAGARVKDVLSFTEEPPLIAGDVLYSKDEGVLRTVLGVFPNTTQGTFEAFLDIPLTVLGSQNFYLSLDITQDTSLRMTQEEDLLRLYRTGYDAPIATVAQNDLPIAADVFGTLVRPGQVFCGSLSRQAGSTVEIDFFRVALEPLQDSESSSQIVRSADLSTANTLEPFIPLEASGHYTLEDVSYLYHKQLGSFGLNFIQQEPFLTPQTVATLDLELTIQAWSKGIPFTVSLCDQVRELTLGLFDVPAPGGASTDFEDLYTGERRFEDEGWTALTSPYVILDQGLRITKTSTVLEVTEHTLLGRGSRDSYVSSCIASEGRFFFGVEDGAYIVHLGLFDDAGMSALYFCDASGSKVLKGGLPLGVFYEPQGKIHDYTIKRQGAAVTIYVDGAYLGAFDVTDLPPSTATDATSRFGLLEAQELTLKGLSSFSTVKDARQVGIYQGGGDRTSLSNYLTVPVPATSDWYGDRVKLSLVRDPQGLVTVKLDDVVVSTQAYQTLPLQEDRSAVVYEEGYILWGTEDSSSLASALVFSYEYAITNNPIRDKAYANPVLNAALVAYSGEVLTSPLPSEKIFVLTDDGEMFLDQLGFSPDRVIGVFSLDKSINYSFTISERMLYLPLSLLKGTEVLISFYEDQPWTKAYQGDKIASVPLLLEVGTPTFWETEQYELKRTNLGPFQGTLPQGAYYDANGDLIIFEQGNSRALYSSLEMITSCDTVGTAPDLIASACEDLKDLELSPYEDVYAGPQECPPLGLPLIYNDPDDVGYNQGTYGPGSSKVCSGGTFRITFS